MRVQAGSRIQSYSKNVNEAYTIIRPCGSSVYKVTVIEELRIVLFLCDYYWQTLLLVLYLVYISSIRSCKMEIESTGIKLIRPVYSKGNGFALQLTGEIALICGLRGAHSVEVEILKDKKGMIVRSIESSVDGEVAK